MRLLLLSLLAIIVACKNNDAVNNPPEFIRPIPVKIPQTDTINKVLSTNVDFYTDSVFHGHRKLLAYYFKKYCADLPCSPIGVYQDKNEIKKYFEGVKYIGSIKNKRDSVFVLNPIVLCAYKGEEYSDGQAYYFTDSSLPRLQTDSYCCHPENLFTVGDINEDGISEIGIYYSGCASRYKLLKVYTLKNNLWKEIGSCIYDLSFANQNRPFKDYVKKTAKNTFEMLEITDLPKNNTKKGKPNWLHFSM